MENKEVQIFIPDRLNEVLSIQSKDVVVPTENKTEVVIRNKYKCQYCEKLFTFRTSRNRHYRKIHLIKNSLIKLKKCPVASCEYVGSTLIEVRHHMTEVHNVEFEQVSLDFPNEAEFCEWKLAVQSERKELYISQCGSKKRPRKLVKYLFCHRSGDLRPRNRGLHKERQSAKLGLLCTATMKVEVHSTGHVHVDWCKTHYGHQQGVYKDRILRNREKKCARELNSSITDTRQNIAPNSNCRKELPDASGTDPCQNIAPNANYKKKLLDQIALLQNMVELLPVDIARKEFKELDSQLKATTDFLANLLPLQTVESTPVRAKVVNCSDEMQKVDSDEPTTEENDIRERQLHFADSGKSNRNGMCVGEHLDHSYSLTTESSLIQNNSSRNSAHVTLYLFL